MKNEFVTHEQALAVKELGFNEECLGYYNIDTYLSNPAFNLIRPFEHEWCLPAPLKQQAFKWFREKHNLIGIVEGGYTDGKNVFSYVVWRGSDDDWADDYYDDYDKVENMLIDKLIEILKQRRDGRDKNQLQAI